MILIYDLLQMVYNMAPFPYPKIVELREKYTYNIHPLANNASSEKKSHKDNKKTKDGYISSDDDDDDVNQLNIGCLGLISSQATYDADTHKVCHSDKLALPLNFTKPVKDSDTLPTRTRPFIGVSDLEKEYDRTRKMQQKAVVVFSPSKTSKSQDLREIPPAINHLFVVTRSRRNKWKEHLQKERQRQDKLLPVREEDEDWEGYHCNKHGQVKKHLNEHVTDAAEHLFGLFTGAVATDSPSGDQDISIDKRVVADIASNNQSISCAPFKQAAKETNSTQALGDFYPLRNLKTKRDLSQKKPGKTSLSIPTVDPSLVLPDKNCIYPAKFSPFPGTRAKVSKSGLLYGKRSESETPRKKPPFISGPPMPFHSRTYR